MNATKRKMQKSGLTLILTALFVTLLLGAAAAQDVANGVAQGTVVPLIVVTADQPLDFGNVYQGVLHNIAETDDDSSAIFTITGQTGAGINLQFILPEYLVLADGSDRIPVRFGATDAAVDTNGATPSTVVAGDGWVNQNPYILPAAASIGSNVSANTRVYLGGQLNPSINQKAGAYSADLILMVAYRDN